MKYQYFSLSQIAFRVSNTGKGRKSDIFNRQDILPSHFAIHSMMLIFNNTINLFNIHQK